MMSVKPLRNRLADIWEKNGPDVQSALFRKLPRFFYAPDNDALADEVPVFVFHSVTPARFEKQLQYLAENHYATLGADDLLEKMNECGKRHQGRLVALTFDDALGSFWSVAYPLLRKYGFTAILFVAPGLVPDDKRIYPVLGDATAMGEGLPAPSERERFQPLCTWPEINAMHSSGLVDVQSHSMTHSRVNISPGVHDFLHPGFSSYVLGKLDIPVRRNESAVAPGRTLRPGQPVYESASRLSGRLRFLEDTRICEALVSYVTGVGGDSFFSGKTWRNRLHREYRQLIRRYGRQIRYETPGEMRDAVLREFRLSRTLLESRLPGKRVRHFCYPWYQGSGLGDRVAGECGYNTVYYGMKAPAGSKRGNTLPRLVRRVSEEYLFCLPGTGRGSVFNVWSQKIRNIK